MCLVKRTDILSIWVVPRSPRPSSQDDGVGFFFFLSASLDEEGCLFHKAGFGTDSVAELPNKMRAYLRA